jgi:hypothetical protein
VRKVVVHLALHAFYLHSNRSCDLRLARTVGKVGLLQQDGEGRFQRVRQIARFGLRPLHHSIALSQEGIEIVHERLHFRWEVAIHAPSLAAMNGGQPMPQLGHRRHTPADLEEAYRQ